MLPQYMVKTVPGDGFCVVHAFRAFRLPYPIWFPMIKIVFEMSIGDTTNSGRAYIPDSSPETSPVQPGAWRDQSLMGGVDEFEVKFAD